MNKKRLFLIDATAFCYRAFFAIKGLATSYGQPTNAVFGFVTMLNKLLREFSPEYLAICFDVGRDTFRQKKFSEYKIHRPAMPDALSSQIPLIKEIISAFNFALFEKEGYEADDIVASITEKFKDRDLEIFIISSDKDILQLIDEDIFVFSPYKEKEGVIYTRKKVLERFGIEPEDIPEFIALSGDATDNIPGVKGIGEKTAVELLKRFKSIDNLIKNLESIEPERIRNSIKDNLEMIRLSRELALLSKDVPLKFDIQDLKLGKPDYKKLFKIYKSLEFKILLKEIPRETESILNRIKIKEDLEEAVLIAREKKEFSLSLDEVKKILYLYFGQPDEIFILKSRDGFKPILEDPKIKKTGHNLKRIKVSLFKESIDLKGISFDTMVASYILDPAKPSYSIKDLGFEYLDIFLESEDERILEAVLSLKLKSILEEKLKEKNLETLFYNLEMPLIEVLSSMEINGVSIDLEELENFSKELDQKLKKTVEEIYQISKLKFNLNSPKQLGYILFEELKLPVIKRTKTGPSTDEEVLKKLANQQRIVKLILEYREFSKLKSTYIDAFKKLIDLKTKKIHTHFSQAGTETGRLTSSQPNLQNIPIKTEIGARIRKCFIPSRKENLLISFDYSQIELRVLAHLSEDENLLSCFKKDIDIHKYTASLIYDLEQKDITEQMRQTAKRINFGIIYGMSAFGLSKDLGMTQEEANSFIESYFLRYPKVKEYITKKIQEARELGYVTTLLGRRRYLPQINSKIQNLREYAERQAVNTPIQGTAADLIKLAMVNISQTLKEKSLSSKMILQVHDELIFDVPESEVSVIKDLVREKMENVIKLSVSIRVGIKVGKNWLEMEEVK